MKGLFIAVVAFAAGVAFRDQAEEWKPTAPAEPPIQLSHPIPYDASVTQEGRTRYYVRKEEQ